MPQPPRKYQALAEYLAAIEVDEVTLSFTDIERIMGAQLPAGAYAPLFWVSTARSSPSPNSAWRSVGWRAVTAPPGGPVVFRRTVLPDTPPAR